MSLNKEYNKETGLHSHYVRRVCIPGNNGITSHKRELVYTRKYVWYLENKIKEMKEDKNDNTI